MVISKIQDSLIILSTLAASVEEYFRMLKQENQNKESVIYAALSSQILLQACSFKEELRIFYGVNEERERVTRVSQKSQYFTKKINQWTDLEKIRNTYIAHNFRDRSDGYSNRLLKPYGRELNVPNRFPDYIILCGCIDYTSKIILQEFMVEFNSLAPVLRTRKAPIIKAGANDISEAIKELQMIIDKSKL
jgi:Golgi nucleoside diphosphatase